MLKQTQFPLHKVNPTNNILLNIFWFLLAFGTAYATTYYLYEEYHKAVNPKQPPPKQ